jgi:hypothetical protein
MNWFKRRRRCLIQTPFSARKLCFKQDSNNVKVVLLVLVLILILVLVLVLVLVLIYGKQWFGN